MLQPPRDRKDHYVPQSYLRGFIDPARARNDRPLWCLDKRRNEWVRKAPAQICHVQGMYDFSNDAIEAEHADVTFKSMEDGLGPLREGLVRGGFAGWYQHIDFLLPYMQMIRVRSPQYFVEQGQAVADSFIGRITSIDETRTKVTYDSSEPLSEDQVHDMTLTKMRDEFAEGPPCRSWYERRLMPNGGCKSRGIGPCAIPHARRVLDDVPVPTWPTRESLPQLLLLCRNGRKRGQMRVSVAIGLGQKLAR